MAKNLIGLIKTLIGHIPIQFGINLGSIKQGMIPAGVLYLKSSDVKLNNRILDFNIVQRFNEVEISSSPDTYLERLYIKLSGEKIGLTGGDEFMPLSPMFDNSRIYNITN